MAGALLLDWLPDCCCVDEEMLELEINGAGKGDLEANMAIVSKVYY
jgi:hypothetical protein